MKNTSERLPLWGYLPLTVLLAAAFLLSICIGSVNLPLADTLSCLRSLLTGQEAPATMARGIILNLRLPRALNAALTGAALSLSGAAMQGLLRNPLADGSTLGVSSGASLGAVLSLAFGFGLTGGALGSTALTAMLSAFLSLLVILALAWALDRSLSTSSIILIGVIFSMFASSLISLVVSFAGDRVRAITFWTMGSLASTNLSHAKLLTGALLVGGGAILLHARELNAFAIGEENARHIGVNVRRVKLVVLAAVAALIGVCVSVGGTIGFVGLVVPHMVRRLTGPNHRRLLPASLFAGAIFLLLADLAARTLLRPIELSIGVVTSLVGAAAFLVILCRTRKGGRPC